MLRRRLYRADLLPATAKMLRAWALLLIGCLRTTMEKGHHRVLESTRAEQCLSSYEIYHLV